MACTIASGYSLGCRDNTGGIQEAYIGNFGDQTYTLSATGSIATVVSGTISYYTFEQENEVGQFDQTGQYSTENGTVFFEQNLTLMFHKNTAELRDQLLILSQANLSVIVKDQRGTYWLMGYQNGCRVTEGSMNTGKAYGDMNGITLTIQGKEPEPARKIDNIDEFSIT